MPTTVVETDTFAASVQRPNNGELADAASILQYESVDASRDRFLYNRSRGALFDVTRTPYGADPLGVAASQAAFDAATTAAAAAGGDVFIPPGTYLYTGWSIPQGVNVWAAPGVFLVNTGAGSSIVFTQPNDGPDSTISGIRFLASGANTATCVVNNAGARGRFERCSWNGFDAVGAPSNNLQGKIASVNAVDSELLFVDCRIGVVGTLKGLHATNGKIRVARGVMSMPALYADALAYADSTGELLLDGVRFDVRAHTTGTAELLYTASSAARGALRDCVIDGTGAAGTIYGHLWIPGALVAVHGNIYLGGTVTPYGNSTAAAGSRIELEPTLAIDIGSAPTVDLSNSGRFGSILVKGTENCAVTLPAGIFPGQVLHYTHYNASVTSSRSISFAGTPVTGFTIPNPGIENTLSGIFVWESRDVSGAYRWVQKGTWGVGLTLV